jgi:hypothetical protein
MTDYVQLYAQIETAFLRALYVEQGGRCAVCRQPKGLEELNLIGSDLVCDSCICRGIEKGESK